MQIVGRRSKLLSAGGGDDDEDDDNEVEAEVEADRYEIGSREEGRDYWTLGLGAWYHTEGAISWFLSEAKDLFSLPEETSARRRRKVGRNDPCPCGSGRKYKRCCLQ